MDAGHQCIPWHGDVDARWTPARWGDMTDRMNFQYRRVASSPRLLPTIGEVACPCDTESVEITRWAVNAVGSCDRVPESRLACSRRLLGTASRPKMICCEHIGQSVSTWDLGMRADGSMRAEAGIALSYLALTLTAATRPGMAK